MNMLLRRRHMKHELVLVFEVLLLTKVMML